MISESNADYHANRAISHSKLECYRRRPALFYKRFVLQMLPPPKESNALRIGSAAHCAILEEQAFLERYVVLPDIDRRTKEGKALFAEFSAQHAGKTFLTEDELDQLMQMRIAVEAHPIARELLSAGQPEVTWRTPDMHGMRLQCRTDWWNAEGCEASDGKPYVVDIKTVESLDRDAFRNFERAVFSFGYHRQAGFYLPLINELHDKPVSRMYYIAVEKVEPYGVGVYRLSDEAIGRGMDENTTDLMRLKRSFDEDDWPNIEPGVRELGLPTWYGRDAT
jgi:hypothetical protein